MKKFMAIGIAFLLAGCDEYSDGDRVGVIQKFSRKGFVAKTWEGEMMLGGLKRQVSTSTDANNNVQINTNMVANVWNFTVEDAALVQKVQALMEEGKLVKAHYRQEILASPFRTETGLIAPYFLVSVEAVK